jgi:hypothetical protein
VLQNPGKIAYEVTKVRFNNAQVDILNWSKEGDRIEAKYRFSNRVEYDTVEGVLEIHFDLDKPSRALVPFKAVIAPEIAAMAGLKDREASLAAEESVLSGAAAVRPPIPGEAPSSPTLLINTDPATAPRIEVDQDLADFGVVPQGQEVEADFQIRNAGHGDLIIDHVQSGCGCATVNDLKGVVIPPGGQEKLIVRLSTQNKALDLTKSVKVYSNDPLQQPLRLALKAYVHVDYLLQNPLIKYSDYRKGTEATQRIPVKSFMETPLVLDDFQCDRPFVHCTFGRDEALKDPYYIDVTVDTKEASFEEDSIYGQVSFHSNSEQLPKGSFTRVIESIKDIKYTPRKIFLYRYSNTSKEDLTLELENVLGKDFKIAGIDMDLDCLDAEVLSQGGSKAEVRFKLNDKAVKGRFNGQAVIRFDYEDQKQIELPVTILIIE